MTASEINELLDIIEDNYPRDSVAATGNALEMWNESLGEFSKETGLAAVREWIKESPYAPKPANIRKLALKIGGVGRKEDIETVNLFYRKVIDGRDYECVALVARNPEEARRIRDAGYKRHPIVIFQSEAYNKMIRETEEIAKARKDVSDNDLHNFKRDDQKP